ncbi:hypothetical protein ACTXT7_016399 [Hymenolepis weldensis]
MGGERADDKPVPEEEVLSKETRERAALMSRVKQYTLNQQITSELIQGVIRPPLGQLCACHLRELFVRFGERADDKPVPEEEVLSRETRDVKAVGGSENKTTAMSNPAQPFNKLLTYGFTSHAATFRNRYLVTIPGLYEEIPDPDHSTAFVLNTTFLGPFISKYWHAKDKALLNTKWNSIYPFITFGKARIKVSRLIPSTRQATGAVVSVDKVQFDNSNYMLVGISKGGYPNQLQPIKQLSTYKTICAKGGFYISNMNVMDMTIVKTVGASGEFHHEFSIPNPLFRYFYRNPDINGNDFHILPRDYDTETYMANKCPRFQPSGPDNQTVILQMPFQRCLGESTEVVSLYGNVVIETELEVMFHSVLEHVQPVDKEQYILDNSIELLDYKGKEGKDLNPVYYNAYIK